MSQFPQDEHEYGPELIDAAQRWAKPVVDQRVGQLESQLNHLRSTVDQQQAIIAQQRIEAALDADPELSSRWRALNTDIDFIAWLNQPDDYVSLTRMQLLHQACSAGAVERVLALFKAGLTAQLPSRQRTTERRPFESGGRQPAARADNLGRRMWTRAEIARFYEDRRRGVYDGPRESEGLAIEQDIVNAARVGRVVNPPARMPGERW